MKNTNHIFTTIGLIILAITLVFSVTSCNGNNTPASTTATQKDEKPVEVIDKLPDPTEEGYLAKFVNSNQVVDKFAFTDELKFPEALARVGYNFVGWSDGIGIYEAGTTVVGFDADKTFTSVWEQCTIKLICNDDMNMEFTIPAEVIYTTPSTAGAKQCTYAPVYYEFIAWKLTELDANGEVVDVREVAPGTTIIVNNNIVLEAIWELPSKS